MSQCIHGVPLYQHCSECHPAPEAPATPTVAGLTLDEWRSLARRDDCLDSMSPSDLRQLLAQIDEFK
jgi:hypothetical protein